MGLLVSPDLLAQGEIPDHLDHQDQVVHPEAKVFQETPDLLGRKAHLDFLDRQAALDRRDNLDLRDLLVKVESLVRVVLRAPWVLRVSPDLRDRLVRLVVQEVRAHLARKDLQGHPDQQVQLGSRDPSDRLDPRDLPAQGVSQVMPDHQETLAPLDHWVLLVTMAYRVLLDQLVRGALLVPVELREALDLLVHPDHRAPEAPMVSQANRDRSVLWELLDTLDNKD